MTVPAVIEVCFPQPFALPHVARAVQDADLAVATAPTAIALRPARREQIRPTRLLVGEPPLELDDRSREVRTRHQPTVRRTSDGTNRIVTTGS